MAASVASSSVCGDLANPLLVTFMLHTPAGLAPRHDDNHGAGNAAAKAGSRPPGFIHTPLSAPPAVGRPWGTYEGQGGVSAGLAGLASAHDRGVATVGGAAPVPLFPGLRPSASPLFPTYPSGAQAAGASGTGVPLFASGGGASAGSGAYAGSASATPTPLFKSSAGAPAAIATGTSSFPGGSFPGSFPKPAASAGATPAASPASSFPAGGFSSFMAARSGGGGGGGGLEGAILDKMRREAERQRQLAAAKAEAANE